MDALDGDPELSEALATLTPGQQRSYAIASAKASATRVARIANLRGKILQGKGANECKGRPVAQIAVCALCVLWVAVWGFWAPLLP